MKQPMVYVAGPISTGGDITGNTRRGVLLSEQLRKMGFAVFCPHLSVFAETVAGVSPWEEWLAYDEEIIQRCDAVFRMAGESRGADRETTYAKAIGIPVFTSIEEMVEWKISGRWYMRSTEKLALDALQDEIGSWGDRTFGQSSPLSVLAHLKKEVNELLESKEPEEIADVQMLLIHFAHKMGVSIRDEVRRKFEINKRRKWGKPDSDGVVEHVREVDPA